MGVLLGFCHHTAARRTTQPAMAFTRHSPSNRFYVTSTPGCVADGGPVLEYAPGRRMVQYVQHVVRRVVDDAEVAQWKEAASSMCQALMGFYVAGGVEWLIGGTHYMYKLFVNCDTGAVYDDVTGAKPQEAFIWTNVLVSPCGTKLVACGCVWAFPMQKFLYDLSPLEASGRIGVPSAEYRGGTEDLQTWICPCFADGSTEDVEDTRAEFAV
jgi:hypothetical protein